MGPENLSNDSSSQIGFSIYCLFAFVTFPFAGYTWLKTLIDTQVKLQAYTGDFISLFWNYFKLTENLQK